MRFRDLHSEEYYDSELQIARQRKGETPREFLDRLRDLANKTIPSVDDPLLKSAYLKTTEKRLLSAFKFGLLGVPGPQTTLQRPKTVEEAWEIAEATVKIMAQDARQNAFYAMANPASSMQEAESHNSRCPCHATANASAHRPPKGRKPRKQVTHD
jgi:hypothetical protein